MLWVMKINAKMYWLLLQSPKQGLCVAAFGLFEEWRCKELSLATKSHCRFALAPKSATKSAHNDI